MALDLEAFRQAVRVGVRQATGLPDDRVIFHFPGAPLPEGPAPFAVIAPHTAIAASGYGSELDLSPDGVGIVALWARRRITVSVNIYGTEAVALMQRLTEHLEHEPIRDAMELEGATLWRVGEARDLTGFMETDPRERAQVDLFFGTASATEVDVGQIDHVEATGLFDAGASGTIQAPLTIDLEGP